MITHNKAFIATTNAGVTSVESTRALLEGFFSGAHDDIVLLDEAETEHINSDVNAELINSLEFFEITDGVSFTVYVTPISQKEVDTRIASLKRDLSVLEATNA